MTADRFNGPLFIVGMPRSGTKLLRDLLNQHPQIGIPVVESHFLPYMINQFGRQPNFDHEEIFEQFYLEFTRTPFFWNMQQEQRVLKISDLAETADLTSWASIFMVIMTYYAPPDKTPGFIWGDKTPGYLQHISLLRSLYPQARVLHIIRDPRDYCLSVNKAWNKNIYRAAEAWRRTIAQGRAQGEPLAADYKEVRYEDLLDNPERVLSAICQFLECAFDPQMLTLSRASENLGDARGHTEILRHNTRKYQAELSDSQVQRIEEIVYPVAVDLNYQIELAGRYVPLNPLHKKVYNLMDGWSSVKFHVDEKGFREGVSYFYRLHKNSSWR